MTIVGLYGEEALTKFAPAQHVNIWDVLLASFYCEARMDSLPEEVRDDPESFYFEPTAEDGNVVNLKDAICYVRSLPAYWLQ